MTVDRVNKLVHDVNQYLLAEVSKPKANTDAIRQELAKRKQVIKRLTKILEQEDEDVVPSIVASIKKHKGEVKGLSKQLRELDAPNFLPKSLEFAEVMKYIEDFRSLLNQDVAKAASAIAALTGRIYIHKRTMKGAQKSVWIAEFSINMVNVLLELSNGKNCPTRYLMDHLNTRSWTILDPVRIEFKSRPFFQVMASECLRLIDKGMSVIDICRKFKKSKQTIVAALKFAKTGVQPKYKGPNKNAVKRSGPPKYVLFADRIVDMKDGQNMPFKHIAKDLGVSADTVLRGYVFKYEQQINEMIVAGKSKEEIDFVKQKLRKMTLYLP